MDPPAPADTPVMQGGPERAGRIVGSGVRAPLEKAWSLAVARRQFGPVLADGRLFLRVGELDERTNLPVVAYNVWTGAELWRAPHTRFSVDDEVAYANGRVFVGGHETFALNARTGARLWTLPVYSDNPIATRDGRLILGGVRYTKAVDPVSGAEQWTAPVGEEWSPSTVARDLVFRDSNDTAIAYDLASGAVAWRQTGGTAGDHLPGAFDGGLMWVGGRAFDIRTGLIAHRSEFRSSVAISAPLGYQIQGGALVAFDLRTFETSWSFPLHSGDAWLYGSRPLVVDDLVFLAIGSGVYAIDRVTGALVWTGTLSGKALAGASLAAGSGHLVVPYEGGVDVFRTPGTAGEPGESDPGQGGPGGDPADGGIGDDPAGGGPVDADPTATPGGGAGGGEPVADPASSPASGGLGGSGDPFAPPVGGAGAKLRGPDAGGAAQPLHEATTLRISARRSERRVVIAVRGPAKATGRVVVKVGRHSVTRSLKRGAVTVHVLLRRGERPTRVAVRYTGDARFAPTQANRQGAIGPVMLPTSGRTAADTSENPIVG